MKIEIVMGFACNNNCKFCSVGSRDVNKATDTIKAEIDEAAREAPSELNFTGGEPTIRKDLAELISYASGRFPDIRITTNGRMLSYPRYARSLVEAGLTGAIFSVHSHRAAIHDYLTSVKGCFNQLMNGMENLSDSVTNISVNTVINSLNYKSLPDLGRMLLKMDIRSLCLIYPTIDGNLLDNLTLLPKYGEVSKWIIETVEVLKAAGIPAWALNIPACFLPGHERLSNLMKLETKMFWPDMKTDLDLKKHENKFKTKNCGDCTLDQVCPGIQKEYADIYGESEFCPVKRKLQLDY